MNIARKARQGRKNPVMGMKKRPTIHCAVVRGEMRSWEHCQCSACLTKQIAVLNKRLEKAKENEG